MNYPQAIQQSILKFRKDYPNPEQVGFLMMRFANKAFYPKLVVCLRDSFMKERISLVRADDKEYHPDLFTNIQTYMHGCGFGVAVFDKIGVEDFNPNVSLEVGYMLSMHKEILFLKDKELKSLNADLMGRLYKDFDTYDIPNTVPDKVKSWVTDKGYCYSCSKCYVELAISMSGLVSKQDKVGLVISDLIGYNPTDSTPRLLGIKPNADNENAILVFEGDIEFSEYLVRLKKANKLKLSSTDIEIIGVNSDKPYEPIQIINSGKHTWQICYANSWEGDSSVIYNGYSKIGTEKAFKVTDCKVYLTISSDNYLVAISNMICFGKENSTKIRAPLWLQPEDKVKMIDLLRSIAAFEDLSIKPTENEIILSNVKDVKYIIDKQNGTKILDLIDFCGARNIQVL
jgi:hypothetical protein